MIPPFQKKARGKRWPVFVIAESTQRLSLPECVFPSGAMVVIGGVLWPKGTLTSRRINEGSAPGQSPPTYSSGESKTASVAEKRRLPMAIAFETFHAPTPRVGANGRLRCINARRFGINCNTSFQYVLRHGGLNVLGRHFLGSYPRREAEV